VSEVIKKKNGKIEKLCARKVYGTHRVRTPNLNAADVPTIQ
jgi:hypothetical protein